MPVPPVQAFGYGYLQGAEAATEDLGMKDGAVSVTYHYTGDFAETDTNKATAKTMYQEGTEVIFGCGGSVGKSVIAAASEANKKMIGVDVDQRYDSDMVITSAMKGLGSSVKQVLESIYKTGSWDDFGGKTTTFDATNDGVGLPTTVIGDKKADAFDRFNKFTEEDYEKVFATLKNGDVKPVRTIDVADADGYATAEELTSGLNLKKVTVEVR